MGVSQVWEIVRECQPNPVPRCPIDTTLRGKRVAIDVYHILFECGFFNRGLKPSELGKPLVNLMHRMKELIALDTWFLLIFDGDNKPAKIRNGPLGTSHSTDPWGDTGMVEVWRNNNPYMRIIHELLDKLNVSSVTTTGEGEAFCCYLQSELHVVDYVWSNDSDCLIFGGTHLLRNFSRQVDDVGVTSEHNKYFNKERINFITSVDYPDLVANCGMLNRKQLLLFSVLLGGDYNTGVKGLGKVKSLEIVKMTDPDFSSRFYDLFHNINEQNQKEKESEYLKFQADLFNYCRAHTLDLFGRNYQGVLLHKDKEGFEGWPTIDIVVHYFHPSMLRTFDPYCTAPIFSNITKSKGYDKVDFLTLRLMLQRFELGNVTNFDKWFHETMHEMFLLKYILYEFGKTEEEDERCRSLMKITEEKSTFVSNLNRKVSLFKVRYNTFLDGVEYTPSAKSAVSSPTKSATASPIKSPAKSPTRSPNRSPSKRQLDILKYPFSMWIHQSSIPDTNILVQDFQEQQAVSEEEERLKQSRKRVSPKKMLNGYKQNNTLDAFFKKSTSPLAQRAKPVVATQSIPQSRAAALTPVKRQLFVADPEVSEAESSLIITDTIDKTQTTIPEKQEDEEEDSLVIIDEVQVAPPMLPETTYIRSSPTKRIKPSTPAQRRTTIASQASELRSSVILSPKKTPFLSRTDTFGSRSSKSSLLSALESEVDQVVREANSDSSDTTTTTASTDSSGQSAFNDSDDIFLEL